jgi:hypothetical protein
MYTQKHIRHEKFLRGILCLLVAVSFVTVLVPIASASRDKSSSMPCCAGKAAGHCDSGIAPKPTPRRFSEPMCGLHNSESTDDAITIVAESSEPESHHSHSQTAEKTSHAESIAAESISLSHPCPMDCGACTASSQRQQRRERSILQPIAYHNPSLIIHFSFENQPFSFSSNEDWDQISPRGPPASS